MEYKKIINELREQGLSREQIRKKLNCSEHTLSVYMPGPLNDKANKIIELRKTGKSISEIVKELKYSKSTVSKWCKQVENNEEIKDALQEKIDAKHKELTNKTNSERIEHLSRNEKSSVYEWKKILVDARRDWLLTIFGSKCCHCGFNESKSVLDFHHVDTNTKKFKLSGRDLLYHSIEEIVKEAEKCILLCSNHHGMVHVDELDCSKYELKELSNIEIPDNVKKYHHLSLTDEMIVREKNWVAYKLKYQNRELHQRNNDLVDLNLICIKEIKFQDMKDFLSKYHYLGPSFKGSIKIFGFYNANELIGVAQVANPVRNLKKDGFCELSRFCLNNNTQNLASKCLSLVINEIKKTDYKFLQAFADETFHKGTIYKAVGFIEDSITKESYNYSGIHKKTIFERASLYNLHEDEYARLFALEKKMEGRKIKFIKSLK